MIHDKSHLCTWMYDEFIQKFIIMIILLEYANEIKLLNWHRWANWANVLAGEFIKEEKLVIMIILLEYANESKSMLME